MSSRRKESDSPSERRNTYRYPVSEERAEARLQVGKTLQTVQVVDESAGGFAVEFDGATQLRVGDPLLLEISGEWTPVEVAFLDSQERPAERFASESTRVLTRLGLRRVFEPVATQMARIQKEHSSPRLQAPGRSWISAKMFVAGGAFIASVLLAGLYLALSPNHKSGFHPLARHGSLSDGVEFGDTGKMAVDAGLSLEDRANQSASPRQSRPAATKSRSDNSATANKPGTAGRSAKARDAAGLVGSTPDTSDSTVSEPSRRSPSHDESGAPSMAQSKSSAADTLEHIFEFHPDHLHRVHPELLLAPHMSARLSLRHAQQMQLRQLIPEMRTSASIADDRNPTDSVADSNPSELEARVSLGRRALAILTIEQQKLLDGFLKADSPVDSPASTASPAGENTPPGG